MTQNKLAIEALEPCPFCGGKAECEDYPGEGDWCVTCEISADNPSRVGCQARLSGYPNKKMAIKAWNTRALKSPQGNDTNALAVKTGDLKNVASWIVKRLWMYNRSGERDTYADSLYFDNTLANSEGVQSDVKIVLEILEREGRAAFSQFVCDMVKNDTDISPVMQGEAVVPDGDALLERYCKEHDSEDYPFKGDDYDMELLGFAFDWVAMLSAIPEHKGE